MVFQGPVRPGTSEKKFRETGRSVPKFSGPVRPGTDVKKFRETGRSVPSRSRGRSSASKRAQAEFKAKQAKAAAQAKAAKIIAETKARQKAFAQKQAVAKKTKLIKQSRVRERQKQTEVKEQLLTIQQVRAMQEVQPATKASFTQRQERERERLRTKKERGKKLTLKEEGILAGRTFVQSVSEFGVSIVALPKTLINLAKNPSQLKNVPSSIAKGGERFGQLLRTSPTEAFVKVGTEVLLLKGTGKATRIVGKVGGKATTRLSPKFKGLKKGTITIPSTTKGKNIKIKVGGTVKKIAEPLPKQAALAGKRTTAVSAQADRLVNLIKGKRIVRKPIPGEAKLSKTTKALLKKFDDGKITSKQITLLDEAIKIETEGAGNLLERSFFADPKGRFRPSRLGVGKQKEASLLDVLSGDVTYKTTKPQILVFENIQIQKFPKSLKDIEKALKTGKTLTKSQTKRFVKFQQQKGGKFKPVGGLTKEPEITLAPGEVIKKVKKVGVTLVDGKKVEIVQAKVVKASKTTAKLIKKSKSGKITSKELKELSKRLKKETGFKSSISRSTKLKPRARITKVVPRGKVVTKIKRTGRFVKGSPEAKRFMRKIRKARTTKRTTRTTRTTIPTGRVTTPTRTIRRTPPTRTIRRTPPRRTTSRPPTKPPITPPRKKPKPVKKQKPLSKPVQVFDVFGKSGGKFVKLNPKPLKRGDALSKGAFAVDRTTARTFKIVPKGKTKTPGKLLKSERNYFNRQGFKLREVRIKKGRKFQLKQKYIEKTKHLIDTKSEKSGLTVAKLLQQRRKRKLTPTQKKKMLANLKKARKARMKKLKGGKKK